MPLIKEVYGLSKKQKIKPGHFLVSINGHAVNDVLDYMYYSTDPVLEIITSNNQKIKKYTPFHEE